MRDLLVIDAGTAFAVSWRWTEADGDPIAGFPEGWAARARFGRWLGRAAELELAGVGDDGSATIDAEGRTVVTLTLAGIERLPRWSHFVVQLLPPDDAEPVRFVDGLATVVREVLAGA